LEKKFQEKLDDRESKLRDEIIQVLKTFDVRLDNIQQNFEDRVKEVADKIVENRAEQRAGVRPEKDSGSRKSPFGKVAEKGLTGMALPGSIETGRS
jgi:hypothetical protein